MPVALDQRVAREPAEADADDERRGSAERRQQAERPERAGRARRGGDCRGEQTRRNRLGQHEVERIAQRRVLRAHRGDPRGELRIVRERLVDARRARGAEARPSTYAWTSASERERGSRRSWRSTLFT